jgi:plastocyanin
MPMNPPARRVVRAGMRTSRVLGVLAALVLSLLASPIAPASTAAADANVTVANMAFGPSRVTVGVGDTVTWTFQDATAHTVTSDDGFFDTPPTSGGASRTIRFRSAGTFPYHCSIHSMMVGRVSVPVSATGSAEDGWKLRWLAGEPKNRAYDVQVRRKGSSSWMSLRKSTTTGSARFDPGNGTWQVRARTHKGSATSGWSPAVTLS